MFEISIKEIDEKNIFIIDNTRIYNRLPTYITSIKMSITNPSISNGFISDLDILQYMIQKRVDNEMYKVTSETLGLGTNYDIPDGVYEFKIVINNVEEIKMNIVILNEVIESIKKLTDSFNFDIDVEDNYMFGSNLPLSNEVLRFNYVMALYLSLMWEIGSEYDPIIVNDHINKLQKILSIISNGIN